MYKLFYFEYMEGKISYSVHRSSMSLCSVGISVGFYHRNYDSTTPVGDTVCGFYFNIGLYEGRIWVQQYLRAYSTIFYTVIFHQDDLIAQLLLEYLIRTSVQT